MTDDDASTHDKPLRGVVFDIQRAALHDGPGLRTVVFLKGCPLRCAWCHNPESQRLQPETGLSGKVYGTWRSVSEVMDVVRLDRAFYESSGGGLTVSGGEPTAQFEFCVALLRAAKEEGIETCLDTCGHFPERFLPILLPLVDVWHYDIKATGAEQHQQWTGVDGALIVRNLDLLREYGARIRLRCPVVDGANATPEHLARLQEFEKQGGFALVERLPYHHTGDAKYTDLSRSRPLFASAKRTGPAL